MSLVEAGLDGKVLKVHGTSMHLIFYMKIMESFSKPPVMVTGPAVLGSFADPLECTLHGTGFATFTGYTFTFKGKACDSITFSLAPWVAAPLFPTSDSMTGPTVFGICKKLPPRNL